MVCASKKPRPLAALAAFPILLGGAAPVFLALLVALAPAGARADEFPRVFESSRGLAMGDALTPLAEGFEGMFYNPAGLVMTEEWQVQATYWQEESKDDGQLGGQEFFQALDKLGGKDAVIAEGFLSTVAGRPQSFRTQSIAGFHTGKGFGLAWVDSTRLQTRAAESVPSRSLNMSYDRIYGAVMNLSYASEVRLLMWGVNLKYLTREASIRNVPPNVLTVPAFDAEFGQEGEAEFDIDVGLIGRLPFPFLRPTVGIAFLNLRTPDFGLTDVEPLKREINAGISLQPDFLPDWMKLLVSFERRDFTGTALEDEATRRREGWGAELSLFPQTRFIHTFNIRAGGNQGQASFGLGANLVQFISVEFVMYKEELGEGSHRFFQRRRMLQVKLGF